MFAILDVWLQQQAGVHCIRIGISNRCLVYNVHANRPDRTRIERVAHGVSKSVDTYVPAGGKVSVNILRNRARTYQFGRSGSVAHARVVGSGFQSAAGLLPGVEPGEQTGL